MRASDITWLAQSRTFPRRDAWHLSGHVTALRPFMGDAIKFFERGIGWVWHQQYEPFPYKQRDLRMLWACRWSYTNKTLQSCVISSFAFVSDQVVARLRSGQARRGGRDWNESKPTPNVR